MSRYKVDRSRELIPGYKVSCGHWRSVAIQTVSKAENCQGVDDFNCEQMRVSGCKNHYETVLGAGAKAKSVTSLLTLPSVLAKVLIFQVVVLCYSFMVTTIRTGLSVSSSESASFFSSLFFFGFITLTSLKLSLSTYFFSVMTSTNEKSLPLLQRFCE